MSSAADDPDLQEAHSKRYGENLILFLPLESGRFALLNARHDLDSIVDTIEEVFAKGPTAYKLPPPSRQKPAKEIDLGEINLDDLDLTF